MASFIPWMIFLSDGQMVARMLQALYSSRMAAKGSSACEVNMYLFGSYRLDCNKGTATAAGTVESDSSRRNS